MELKQLREDIFASQQITVAEVATLKEAGFAAIICNRPDNEDPGQPDFAEIAEAAQALGMEVAHQPVTGPDLGPETGAEFGRLMDSLPKPILAYCRSGTRSSHLFKFATT